MSDLYLELRSRIAVVAEKTHVGAARLKEAQSAVGLSNEAVARKIPVSEKTWRRWKNEGTIPTAVLPAVATALRLELHQIIPDGDLALATTDPAVAEEAAETRALLEAIASALGLDSARILRDARLQDEEPQPASSDPELPGGAAQLG